VSGEVQPFNPFQPEVLADPYCQYKVLREQEPVHLSPLGFWIITRYQDVLTASNDLRFSNDLRHYRFYEEYAEAHGGSDSPIVKYEHNWISQIDPPRHERPRALIGQAVARRLSSMGRRQIHQLVDDLLDETADRGEMELLTELAHPLTVLAICHLLGVPSSDYSLFRDWALRRGASVRPAQNRDTLDQGNAAMAELCTYFSWLIHRRRTTPQDDLITALTLAEDPQGTLTDDEIIGACTLLLGAGHEAAANLIANAMFALLSQPQKLKELRANPRLVNSAIEELARYEGPFHLNTRITCQDVLVGEAMIPRGHIVMLCLASANRDPSQFNEPDRLDLSRSPNPHLAFGSGIHFCLGPRLSRLEVAAVISGLFARYSMIELAMDTPEWQTNLLLRGLRKLPIRFRADASKMALGGHAPG
jgi:pimeloyl-[acyl-carrier protein] synthase